jgi:hypothetical protein
VVSITFVGSLEALESSPISPFFKGARVCLLATAAAFRGPREAMDDVRSVIATANVAMIEVEAFDRTTASDEAVVQSVVAADVIVLLDGAPLHARSVWRASPLGEVLSTRPIVAIGSVGSVLGDTMIDPRGGAPTTGLGLFGDVVVSAPAGSEQMTRTQNLLGTSVTLIQLGPGAIVTFDGTWRVVVAEDLVVTRGEIPVSL